MLSEKPSDMRLRAKPRLRLNHWATRLLQHSISDPWPRKRRAPKPTVSRIRLSTRPKPIAAPANSTATTSITGRTP